MAERDRIGDWKTYQVRLTSPFGTFHKYRAKSYEAAAELYAEELELNKGDIVSVSLIDWDYPLHLITIQ